MEISKTLNTIFTFEKYSLTLFRTVITSSWKISDWPSLLFYFFIIIIVPQVLLYLFFVVISSGLCVWKCKANEQYTSLYECKRIDMLACVFY